MGAVEMTGARRLTQPAESSSTAGQASESWPYGHRDLGVWEQNSPSQQVINPPPRQFANSPPQQFVNPRNLTELPFQQAVPRQPASVNPAFHEVLQQQRLPVDASLQQFGDPRPPLVNLSATRLAFERFVAQDRETAGNVLNAHSRQGWGAPFDCPLAWEPLARGGECTHDGADPFRRKDRLKRHLTDANIHDLSEREAEYAMDKMGYFHATSTDLC